MRIGLIPFLFCLILLQALGSSLAMGADWRECLPDLAPYPLHEMRDGYAESDRKRNPLYLRDEAERAPYRLKIEEGKFLDPETGLPGSFRGIFVMGGDGAFYLLKDKIFENVCHSTVFAGGSVAGAGGLRVENGILQYIDTGSGHYALPDESMKVILHALALQGADLSWARVAFGGRKATPEPERWGGNALLHLIDTPSVRLCLELKNIPFPTVSPEKLSHCERALKIK